MKSSAKPTPEQIRELKSLLGSPEHERYFFDRLENPSWIEPLDKARFFSNPPPLQPAPGGGTRWSIWPESRYLARMAAQAPQEVCAIFERMKTDNPAVYGDMLTAAKNMPTDKAVRLVPKLMPELEKLEWPLTMQDASQLCAHLASKGQANSAFQIADALFSIPPSDKDRDSRRDEYWYINCLKMTWPSLFLADPQKLILNVLTWLNLAVQFEERPLRYTASFSWRAAIEQHEQNLNSSFPSQLVDIVRDVLERTVSENQLSLNDLITRLGGYRQDIFRRLQLHLLAQFGEWDSARVRNFIMRRGLFQNYHYVHEYARLLKMRFGSLKPEDQKVWLSWVDEGPDFNEPDQEKRDRLKCYWQFKRIYWIRDHIDGQWKALYDDMYKKFGEPSLADLNMQHTSRWGHTSPYTAAQLNEMGSLSEVLDHVSSWSPTSDSFDGPTREGLVSVFGEYIATKPTAFSRDATTLICRPADYVRSFLNRMETAIRDGIEIDFPQVIALCKWVTERPINERTKPKGNYRDYADQDWQSTRQMICSFIERTCNMWREQPQLSPDGSVIKDIENLLKQLTRDSASSHLIANKDETDIRTLDFLSFAINSPRGHALGATFAYANLLVHRIKAVMNNNIVVPGGIEAIPGLREIIEWQIQNGSFAAFSIIGSRFRLLYTIDRDWLKQNISALFNLELGEDHLDHAYGWASWNTFLVWEAPHAEFYKLLKDQYARAVEFACSDIPEKTQRQSEHEPLKKLGEHLILLYGWGQHSFDDDGSLLHRFLTKAAHKLRSHTIGFVGHSLYGPEDPNRLPEDILRRLMDLWEWYWPNIGKPEFDAQVDVYLFGLWFACGKFPTDWSLEQLYNFAQVAKIPEPDHEVMKQLAKVAPTNCQRAVEILEIVERADATGNQWHVHSWKESAKVILQCALQAGGTTNETANRVLNSLGRRGFVEFSDVSKKGEKIRDK